jgi:hypothetical protein
MTECFVEIKDLGERGLPFPNLATTQRLSDRLDFYQRESAVTAEGRTKGNRPSFAQRLSVLGDTLEILAASDDVRGR